MRSFVPRGAIALLAFWLAASACNFLSGAPKAATPTPPANPQMPAAALNAQSLDAPLPVVKAPVPVTAQGPQWFATANAHCRSGPGIQYQSVDLLWAGEQLAAVGVSADAIWVQVRLPLSFTTCWTESAGGTFQGEARRLGVVSILQPVPTPTLPNPVRRGSDLDVLRAGVSPLDASGLVYLDVRNNGPEDFSAQVRVLCFATSRLREEPYTQATVERQMSLRLTLAAGATTTINTSMATNPVLYAYPGIQCTLTAFQKHDPNSTDNSGSSSIP